MNSTKFIPGNFERWRILTTYGLIIGIVLFYFISLFIIQVIDQETYLTQAEENRTTNVNTAALRGIIYDRNGYILARNRPAYHVVITPAKLPVDEGAIEEIYRRLSPLIDVPVSSGELTVERVLAFKPCQTDFGITEIVTIGDTNAPYDPVRIKCNVSEEIALVVQEHTTDWQGVSIEVEAVRDYPTGEITAEIIGFLGPIPAIEQEYYENLGFVTNRDKIGYAGIEASLQEILSGKNGLRVVEVDVAGQELRDLEPPVEPISGNNVVLTIDTRLQNAARTALVNDMADWNRYLGEQRMTNGVVIAINPKTGEILALVSFPNFDNSRMTPFIPADYYEQLKQDPNRPLFNHAISAEHPPGSVFKMATAIGILNEGVVTPEYQVDDPGKITIVEKLAPNDPGKPRDYVCYKKDGHGMVDYLTGIEQSCDVYFYKVGGGYQDQVKEGLGIWRIGEYAKSLGYGAATGIELPGEADGLMPDPNWKRINIGETWSTGDTYIATIGQGYVLATPLQVLVSIATLANDGKYMQPTLVREVLDSNGEVIKPFEPKMKWDITVDPQIHLYDENSLQTEQMITVEPWVIDLAKQGMRRVVTQGTAADYIVSLEIPSAGKTGTAEYCDNVAQAKNLCQPGSWPTHAWYVGYAPYDDPEIAVIAFVYNGGEGSSVATPIVRQVLDAYFRIKAADATQGQTP
jgi:penicillin-binding protein 2